MSSEANVRLNAELLAQAELLAKMLSNTETILDLSRSLQRLLTLLDLPEDQSHLRDGLAGLLRQLVSGIEDLHRQHRERETEQARMTARLEALETLAEDARGDRAEMLGLLRELHADTLEEAGS